MGLFSIVKKKKELDKDEKNPSKSDQIFFDLLETDEDKYLTSIADRIKKGIPAILNFEALDIDQANKVIAFLSGVVYAINGEIVNVKERVFMFASADVYDDGSMEDFLKEIVE